MLFTASVAASLLVAYAARPPTSMFDSLDDSARLGYADGGQSFGTARAEEVEEEEVADSAVGAVQRVQSSVACPTPDALAQWTAQGLTLARQKSNGRAYVTFANCTKKEQKVSCLPEECGGDPWCFVPNGCGGWLFSCLKILLPNVALQCETGEQPDRPLCPSSPPQRCRMQCPQLPSCPPGQCAMRVDGCCSFQCTDPSKQEEEEVDNCKKDLNSGEECYLWDDHTKGRKALKTGDILFFSDEKIKSRLQRFFTGKSMTHVAMTLWQRWDKSQNQFEYLPGYEDGAVLTLMEVSNHANYDVETEMFMDGFQNGEIYHKLQHQPKSTRIYIRPLKKPLDTEKLRTFHTLAQCLHARRPTYLKWTAMSESTLGKLFDAWMKWTKEEDEKYERMFCSQFVALMVSGMGGPLTLDKENKIARIAKKGEKVLLPGDFDPGDVRRIQNGMYEDDVYQLQLPYPWYPQYELEKEQQLGILNGTSVRDTRSLARQCKAHIKEIPFVQEHLPTWEHAMENLINEETCFFPCDATNGTSLYKGDVEVVFPEILGRAADSSQCASQCEVVRSKASDVRPDLCSFKYSPPRQLVGESRPTAGSMSGFLMGYAYQLCCEKFISCP